MKIHYKDILSAVLIMGGMTAFISGEFIISAVLFAATAIVSNVYRAELEPTNRFKKPEV